MISPSLVTVAPGRTMRTPREAARLLVSAEGRKRISSLSLLALNRVLATFAGADADDILDRGDENLAVTDASGASGVDDRLHGAFQYGILANHLDLYLREEIDHVLSTTVEFGMALLPP